MADVHLALDVAVGWFIGRAAWVAVTELLLKPLLIRFYRRADSALGDHLPDL